MTSPVSEHLPFPPSSSLHTWRALEPGKELSNGFLLGLSNVAEVLPVQDQQEGLEVQQELVQICRRHRRKGAGAWGTPFRHIAATEGSPWGRRLTEPTHWACLGGTQQSAWSSGCQGQVNAQWASPRAGVSETGGKSLSLPLCLPPRPDLLSPSWLFQSRLLVPTGHLGTNRLLASISCT